MRMPGDRGTKPQRGDRGVGSALGPVTANGGSTGASTGGMTSGQQSAFDQLESLLAQVGLTNLGKQVKQWILDGVKGNSLMLQLEGTNEWKQRFAGNEMLRANGLPVLSVGEYLQVEKSYAQVMKNYGLPQGFYDSPADFAKFIGNSVSASELQQRVSAYSDLANREDPAIVEQLKSMGMTKGDILAYTMDASRAAPLIQRQYQTALLGGAARRAGMAADNGYLSKLAGQGVTEQQASQGYGLIAGSLADAQKLSSIDGADYGVSDLQAEVFDSSGTAQGKRKKLASQERARFSGRSGTSGINQSASGSY